MRPAPCLFLSPSRREPPLHSQHWECGVHGVAMSSLCLRALWVPEVRKALLLELPLMLPCCWHSTRPSSHRELGEESPTRTASSDS